MNLLGKGLRKVILYFKDDETRDDFHFKRNALLCMLIFVPFATINELYKGHMKVFN
jgi:hypothetical protein